MAATAPSLPTNCISVAQASELLGCSEDHIRGLISRRELEASRLGKRILIRHSALERLLDRNRI
jgi:excisionase family DNA binding protein